ncbi:PASTA domain-containing protein [Puteibacter caeruleilacunae]|nr:PASTA domain-containing protein [Puteibacter caeruleilacunae]
MNRSMSIKKFILSWVFVKHLVIALAILSVLIFGVISALDWYTDHGESLSVPDFSGIKSTEAVKVAQQKNLRLKVVDSVYIASADPGVVIDQVPAGGAVVKENRTIFITLSSINPENVVMPKIIDVSLRQARNLLAGVGLRLGKVEFRPSQYADLVLEQNSEGKPIKAGDKIHKGSVIDVIVGQVQRNEKVELPELIGLQVDQAKETLSGLGLNTGVLIYDNSIKTEADSLAALVWRQKPDGSRNRKIEVGSSVDLWLTIDEEKFEE